MTDNFNSLFRKYIDGNATETERLEFLRLADLGENQASLQELVDAEMRRTDTPQTAPLSSAEKQAILEHIYGQHSKQGPGRKYAAIAAAIAGLGIALFLWFQPKPVQPSNPQLAEAIKPVSKGVFLTLSSGQQIQLNKQHISAAGGAGVAQSDTSIAYQANTIETTQTLTNNSGKRYQLALADGTEVYLDVNSSVSYPASFNGPERRVTMTGQAYFKVKHNSRQPFRVVANQQLIEDIGTEFNIDAYATVRTTLVQGSAKMDGIMLTPGQALTANTTQPVVADLESDLAWLQDKLIFNHETLESILAKVARIYDVHISWQEEKLKQLRFVGGTSRSKTLASVLNFFRQSGEVDFKVEGKTVTVLPHKKTTKG